MNENDFKILINGIEIDCLKVNLIQNSETIRSFITHHPSHNIFEINTQEHYENKNFLNSLFNCEVVRITYENNEFLNELANILKLDDLKKKVKNFKNLITKLNDEESTLFYLYQCVKYLIKVSSKTNFDDQIIESIADKSVDFLSKVNEIQFIQIFFSCCVARPEFIEKYIMILKSINMKVPILDHFESYVENEYQRAKSNDSFQILNELLSIISQLKYIKSGKLQLEKHVNPNNTEQNEMSTRGVGDNLNLASKMVCDIIKKDDISRLQQYLIEMGDMQNEFDNIKIVLDESQCYTILKGEHLTLIELSAFYGSLHCFKFLLLNNAKISYKLPKYAIAGGNLEIIRICEVRQCSFSQTLAIAIKYHRTDVLKWLVEIKKINLNESPFLIEMIVKYCNMECLIYMLENGYCGPEILTEAIKSNNMTLTIFLLEFIDPNLRSNINGLSPLHEACITGNYDVVQLLLDQNITTFGPIDVNLKSKEVISSIFKYREVSLINLLYYPSLCL